MKLETVEKLIEGDEEAEALYRRETTAKPGGDRQSRKAKQSISDNVTVDHPRRGNTRAYTLERLKRDRLRFVGTGEKSKVNAR